MRAILIALAAAVILSSVAAASPDLQPQRVAITSGGRDAESPFVLTPLGAGVIRRDSGTLIAGFRPESFVMRDGQRVALFDDVVRFKGKRGTLMARYRTATVDAGNGYAVGTGTWKVVRGTGQYAGITGGGRIGDVWFGRGSWSSRLEGFLFRS